MHIALEFVDPVPFSHTNRKINLHIALAKCILGQNSRKVYLQIIVGEGGLITKVGHTIHMTL